MCEPQRMHLAATLVPLLLPPPNLCAHCVQPDTGLKIKLDKSEDMIGTVSICHGLWTTPCGETVLPGRSAAVPALTAGRIPALPSATQMHMHMPVEPCQLAGTARRCQVPAGRQRPSLRHKPRCTSPTLQTCSKPRHRPPSTLSQQACLAPASKSVRHPAGPACLPASLSVQPASIHAAASAATLYPGDRTPPARFL